ncbi:MAG: GNAT family N-acetyltransferase [Bdellovibrionaceae bacterium]|nr:GNAT family N-acetyltransferase [Pseudobdellovibrionaceae bacterium]
MLAAILFYASLSSGFASDGCRPNRLTETIQALSFATENEGSETSPTVHYKWLILSQDPTERVGIAVYEVIGEEMSIEFLSVDEEFRGRGLSRLLLSSILEEHPNIQRIKASLTDDNLAAFESNYRVLEEDQDLFTPCSRAVRGTPAMRIRTSLGFSTILTCVRTNASVELVVRR